MAIIGKTRRAIILSVVVAAIGLVGWGGYRWSHRDQGLAAKGNMRTYPVTRGYLAMSVTANGTIEARNAVEIQSQVEGEATIVSLVPEGSTITDDDVANGKILVELDSSRLRDTLNQQQISYNSAEADYTDAKESLVIVKNQNDSDVQQGLMNVKFARMDLQKYLGGQTADELIDRYKATGDLFATTDLINDPNQLGGESLQKYRELTANIGLAKEELQRAEEDLKWTQRLYEKDYVSKSDLENDRLKAKRLMIQWDQAKTSLGLFIRYEFPKQTEQLFSNYLESERQLERVYAQTRSKLAQGEARLNSSEARYLLNKEQLERIQEQIEACTIKATAPGLVIYASSDRGRRRGGPRTNIDVGESVYERQDIMTITNTDEMNVNVKVHETNIDKVRVGMPVKIMVDAQPDNVYTGEVLKIAPLPDPPSFFGNPDLKEYTTLVSMVGANNSIKPGMSARAEILITELEDALSVPIQSVVNRGGRKVCYLMTPQGSKEQVIETGVFNDKYIQVLDGLSEGQQVLRNPPRLLMADRKGHQTDKGEADKSSTERKTDSGFEKDSGQSPQNHRRSEPGRSPGQRPAAARESSP